MEFFRQLASQLKQFWARLSVGARALFGLITGLCLVAIMGVGIWAFQPEYAVLFSGLPVEDVAAITSKLDAERVPYQLSGGGTTILVPAARVQKSRMDVAVSGLANGPGKGWELFEQTQFGMTPFQQNVTYQRALQTELARTIAQLEQVESARVHIVQPDDTPFVREKQPVTASIVIKPKRGATLSRKHTEAMVALVAGSVKGLTPEHVTVLDTQSRVLSEQRDAFGDGMSSKQLEYQREVESYLAGKAQEILTRVLGMGRATVKVTADINFKRVKESSELYNPDGKVLRKESSKTVKFTPSAVGGVTGAASNVPNQLQPVSFQTTDGGRQEEELESEYLVSRTNRTSEETQGIIQRLTVAVMLTPPDDAADADGQPQWAITAEEAEKLVKQAVGFANGRGDQIQVTVGRVFPVSMPLTPTLAPPPSAWRIYLDSLRVVSLVAALFVAIAMFWLLRRGRKQEEADAEAEAKRLGAEADANAESDRVRRETWAEEIRTEAERLQAEREQAERLQAAEAEAEAERLKAQSTPDSVHAAPAAVSRLAELVRLLSLDSVVRALRRWLQPA
ncbi:MAG: flagellar basal-body MS-ring/collar protein FliF [Planctomycetota bacterium]|nr:flagellar basal-body MS-ring/collar protein FliF [Planctomycetota bacterium]